MTVHSKYEPDRFSVPTVYLTWANPLFLAFFPFRIIYNLRQINPAWNSDSPRPHFSKVPHWQRSAALTNLLKVLDN